MLNKTLFGIYNIFLYQFAICTGFITWGSFYQLTDYSTEDETQSTLGKHSVDEMIIEEGERSYRIPLTSVVNHS